MPVQTERDSDTRQRGKAWYAQIRPLVETEENIGKFCSIDVNTGDYEIDADMLTAARHLRARHPDADVWGERIGYRTAFAIGASLTRTAP